MQTKRANDKRKSSPRDRSSSNKQVVEIFIPSDEKTSPRQLIIEKLKELQQWSDDADELDEIYVRGKKDQDYKRLKNNMSIQRGDSIIIKRIKKDGKDNMNDEVTPANNTKTERSTSVNEEFYNQSSNSTPHSSYSTPHTPHSSASPIYYTPESSPRLGLPENNTNAMHPNMQQPIMGQNAEHIYYSHNNNNYSAAWPNGSAVHPDPSVQYYPNHGTNYVVNIPNQQFWPQYGDGMPQYQQQNNFQQ